MLCSLFSCIPLLLSWQNTGVVHGVKEKPKSLVFHWACPGSTAFTRFLGRQLSTPCSYFLSWLQCSQSISLVSSPFCRLGSFSLLQVRGRLEWTRAEFPSPNWVSFQYCLLERRPSYWRVGLCSKNLGEFHNGYSLPVRTTREISSNLQIHLERTCWHFWREDSPAPHDWPLGVSCSHISSHTQSLAIHQNY